MEFTCLSYTELVLELEHLKIETRYLRVSHTLKFFCLFINRESESESRLLLIDKARTRDKTYIYECRCDERLKTNAEESTRLAYTGLLVELEHLKIKVFFKFECR
jgi:hypothetical protein